MSSETEKTTLQRLMELKDLYESGLITKEEMEAKKLQILGSDNPIVNNSHEEIKDELYNDNRNQADDGYRPSKFSSPKNDEGKEKQTESNSEQINLQNKGTFHNQNFDRKKIFKLSLIAAAVVVVIVILSIVLTPTDYNKKVAKAIEKYELQNATILSSSGVGKSTKDNHFVIFQKGDTIYLDELEHKVPAKAILPRKDGFFIKRIFLTFENERPKASYEMVNEGRRSNLKMRQLLKVQNAYEGKRAVCMKDVENGFTSRSYYYTLDNPDTIFAVNGEFVEENGFLRIEQRFSFADVKDEYIPDWWEYSLHDFVFGLPAYYNTDDMRFHHFSEYCSIDKDVYPVDILKEEFDGQTFDYGFPSIWFGTSFMNRFIGCLEQDVDRKTTQLNLNRILSQTVRFSEMCHEFNSNPVNAKQSFPAGKHMYILARVEKVNYSKLDGFKYVVYTDVHDENCFFHTNDEAFANIDFPTTVLVEAEFNRRSVGEDDLMVGLLEAMLFGVIDTRTSFIFTNAILISCEGCMNGVDYENYYEDEFYGLGMGD